jgi:hypothetical protein
MLINPFATMTVVALFVLYLLGSRSKTHWFIDQWDEVPVAVNMMGSCEQAFVWINLKTFGDGIVVVYAIISSQYWNCSKK